jgi:choline dehydrogenase-like flavoprotein
MNRLSHIDLANADEARLELQAEICIVGAGAIGSYLARELARCGRNVLVIEAGPPTCVDAQALEFTAEFSPTPYLGAVSGRFFGVGGSTSRWGGLLAPHSELDVRSGPSDADAKVWRWIINVVRKESSPVLAALGYPGACDFDTFPQTRLASVAQRALGDQFHVQAAIYLPFRLKNLARLLGEAAAFAGSCRVVHGAVVKQWGIEHGPDGARVVSLLAAARNGRETAVRAKRFVIAAGAIESARILLEIDRASAQAVLPPTAAVGRCLADHLSVPIADVVAPDREATADLFAPRFTGQWMRGFRFLESDPPAATPRCFLHFIFDNDNPGFMLAKEVLVAMQGKRSPQVTPRMIARGLDGLIGLAYGRYVRSRLFIPAATPVRLQLDMEQPLRQENAVTLSDRRDAYGRLVPHIHWRVTDEDSQLIATTATRLLQKWPHGSGMPKLAPRALGTDGTKPHDAYHPVGTCRMGDDPEAVVGRDLRIAGMANAWLASTAVLPGAGTANPTFTLLCLAHKLAHDLCSHA